MIANVHETRVFKCNMQKFFSTISLDVEPAKFGMNFDEHKVKTRVHRVCSFASLWRRRVWSFQ
jgi:hypothetical protein